ncbi:hypothetical protein BWGOE3_27760 [Bacillus mycoides]|uniref:Group-specific protein n=1 Tax=Bacillus cereus MC67 TaxID=1053219 RepID=J8F286_BACCE|nr:MULTISPECIES: hypothetical protein [Bacillus cereus group]EJQ95114.1 hypothetical protein II3_04745 [Bacillus cereus MC67]EOP16165.1 hypothetical protein II1_02122 [Bacillus cereus MC118]OFD42396.1 hypothetical protein BWGOE2_26660 [Bacillus mycoides]OFD46190.1 hypothetical protein BWGOE1_27250 [Bacillus mycoides]OFD46755.1 hypothetical protein BWGOE3_27760 [Bacillus mycoides]
MKYSETIVSKRLRTLKMSGMFFMLVLIAWLGYTKLLYENGFLQEKKNSVKVMNTSITGEIENTFHVNLQGYRKTSLDIVIDASKTDPSELSLIELINTSCSKDCTSEPSTYVKSNHGYIFYTESNGTNVALKIKKQDSWEIEKKSVQNGI